MSQTTSLTDDSPFHEHPIPEGESVSTAVMLAVSDVEDVPVDDLPSLKGAIDPDSLDHLCTSVSAGLVQFDYDDYTVTVLNDESVQIRPAEGY